MDGSHTVFLQFRGAGENPQCGTISSNILRICLYDMAIAPVPGHQDWHRIASAGIANSVTV
jgi:hypothetical protein